MNDIIEKLPRTIELMVDNIFLRTYSLLSNAIKVTNRQIGFGCVVCASECHHMMHSDRD